MIGGMFERTKEGTPQGGPLSPLLANIMLDDLDKELEKRGHRFVRYADDCNIYVKSRRAGERVMGSIRRYVEGRLKLKVNEEKSAVDHPWRRKFLGFSFTNHENPLIRVAPRSIERFKDKVRELTSRRRSMSLTERIHELNQYLRGWMGYFRLAETPNVFKKLDRWIRRRLRMCLLKQWKRGRTRVRELMALGILREEAAKIGGSRKGYWRLTQAPQVKIALGLDYFKSRGLFSLSSVPSTG
jgi:group II intron reverse transcriptase/maturase